MSFVNSLQNQLLVELALRPKEEEIERLPPLLLKRLENLADSIIAFNDRFGHIVDLLNYPQSILLYPNGEVDLERTIAKLQGCMCKLDFFILAIYTGTVIDKMKLFLGLSSEQQDDLWDLLQTDGFLCVGTSAIINVDLRALMDKVPSALQKCIEFEAVSTLEDILRRIEYPTEQEVKDLLEGIELEHSNRRIRDILVSFHQSAV
ncbi:hypothetical protein QR680_014101 [Steinernema hermaphroditum]|uniref:Uncharacterized protein n=1 Tax=Steinernema hermaphroditum TaxID=289476 RepID=A0AA39I9Z5_9BILA|nr:hypothetical protein QR680_014101 [Steinernema hermaphroditum]